MAKTKITADMLLQEVVENTQISPLAEFNEAVLYGKKPNLLCDGDKTEISINRLKPFEYYGEKQPFTLYTTEKINELAENIKTNGIYEPIIVRPIENSEEYQILAGHNRVKAAQIANLQSVPCIVRYVDDVDAIRILTDTNLQHREEIKPSEKAYSYKMRLNSIKRQGVRDNSLVDNLTTSEKSRDIIAEEFKTSGKQVQRYIRLCSLNKELLNLVDEKILPINSGVELSYIDIESQTIIFEVLKLYNCSISIEQAKVLRELSTCGQLDHKLITDIICGTKKEPIKQKSSPSDKTFKNLQAITKKLEKTKESEIFDDVDRDEIENIINSIEVLFRKYFGEAK